MKALNNLGNISLSGGAIGGVSTFVSWIDQHYATIAIGLTALSVIVGIVFKILGYYQQERFNKQMLEKSPRINAG